MTGTRRVLRLDSVEEQVTTLGPGPATCVWTQGCSLRCRGCISPGTWSAAAGATVDVRDLVTWVESTGTGKLTISGGEPFEQAAGAAAFVEALDPGWLITIYSGYTLEELRDRDDVATDALLGRADLLIAGRYERAQHAPLLWRGSANQRIHDLTGRVDLPADVSAGVEVRWVDGKLAMLGVPPAPNFRSRLDRAAGARGITLRPTGMGAKNFPFPLQEADRVP